nr:hypothetical protein [uncultured Draconibacterium sp.]
MKKLKRLAVAFVLIAGVGFGMASCSDDYYYEEPVQPLPPSAENPMVPGTDYPTKPGPDPYNY